MEIYQEIIKFAHRFCFEPRRKRKKWFVLGFVFFFEYPQVSVTDDSHQNIIELFKETEKYFSIFSYTDPAQVTLTWRC